ncbi:MAG: hypothetical protein C0514_03910 [Candidatus Puniceispirillum sp.]|nr:hypothetical protein [Candidatus Puniceispirillum sp.]
MKKQLLIATSFICALWASGAHASATPSLESAKFGFLPLGSLYKADTDESTTCFSLLNKDGSQKATWSLRAAMDLGDVRVSPDENSFVSCDEEGTVRLFTRQDIETPGSLGRTLYTLGAHDLQVRILGFARQDRVLLSILQPLTGLLEELKEKNSLLDKDVEEYKNGCKRGIEFCDTVIASLEELSTRIQSLSSASSYDTKDLPWAAEPSFSHVSHATHECTSMVLAQTERGNELQDAVTFLSLRTRGASLAADFAWAAQNPILTYLLEIDTQTGEALRHQYVPGNITHASFVDENTLLADDRHPVQKHISNMWHIDLDSHIARPMRTLSNPRAPASESATARLRTAGDKGYYLGYAGPDMTNASILSYDAASRTSGVAFSRPEDVISFGLASHNPRGYAILGGQDGNAQDLVILENQDGTFQKEEGLTKRVLSVLEGRKAQKVKMSPQGDQVIVTSLDMSTPGWVTHKDLIDLDSGAHTTLETQHHDMPMTHVQTLASSVDGVTTYTHLYTPEMSAPSTPLLVNLHGGPYAQDTVEYGLDLSSALTYGYSVANINYRGSLGRGKVFQDLIHGDQGGGEVADVAEAITHMLATQPHLDREKVVVMGHSYGAYLATMLDIKYPGLAKGIIAIGGVYDWTKRLESQARFVDAARVAEEEVGLRLSPMTHAHMTHAPMLLIHGTQDDICAAEDATIFAKNLEEAGKKVSLVTLETDHFYEEAEAQQRVMQSILAFTDQLDH